MKIIALFLAGIVLLSLSGCATIVRDKSQPVSFSSDPQDAVVSVNGMGSGRTPCTINIERGYKRKIIEFTKDGYQAVQFPLEKSMSGWILGNIVFGGVIGVVIDGADGKLVNYKDRIHIVLTPEKNAEPPNNVIEPPKSVTVSPPDIPTPPPNNEIIKKEKIIWQPSNRQQVWLLAVGLEKYKDNIIPTLPFAKTDGEEFKNWLMNFQGKNFSRDNTHILFNEQATKNNLLAQIDWLRKEALPEDLIIIYYAGHGAPELASDGKSVDAKYLVLYDTDPAQLFATGLSLDELNQKLDVIKAKTQLVILEACYSGPVGQEIFKKTPTADLEIRPRYIEQMGEKSGRVILSASSGRQIAIGSDDIKGGLFTHYLLAAWGDGSRRLLSDCFEDAKEKVRRAANRLGSTQEPCIFGDRNIDIILK